MYLLHKRLVDPHAQHRLTALGRFTLRLAAAAMSAAVLAGCAVTADLRNPAVDAYQAVRQTPALPVVRNASTFAEGLSCMDNLLARQAAEVRLLVEEISDKTQRVQAGPTDMLLSALSSMSRRSQAIHAVSLGEDGKGLAGLLRQNQPVPSEWLASLPPVAIRGAVTQADDHLTRQTADAGGYAGLFKQALGGGHSSSGAVSEIALDLHVLRTKDQSLMAGVTSQNRAAIVQAGTGRDLDLSVGKLGVSFQSTLARAEGRGIALRNLIDLAAIELVGKLAKVPYWLCLGVSADHPEVQREQDDWWVSMPPAARVAFFLPVLRSLRLLTDRGTPAPALVRRALSQYAVRLGLGPASIEAPTFALFTAHLRAVPPDASAPPVRRAVQPAATLPSSSKG